MLGCIFTHDIPWSTGEVHPLFPPLCGLQKLNSAHQACGTSALIH